MTDIAAHAQCEFCCNVCFQGLHVRGLTHQLVLSSNRKDERHKQEEVLGESIHFKEAFGTKDKRQQGITPQHFKFLFTFYSFIKRKFNFHMKICLKVL